MQYMTSNTVKEVDTGNSTQKSYLWRLILASFEPLQRGAHWSNQADAPQATQATQKTL